MMPKGDGTETISDAYLRTLEEVKKQYQQYVEVSKLYELPIYKEDPPVQYAPPSLDNPLTTDTFRINDSWGRHNTPKPFRNE